MFKGFIDEGQTAILYIDTATADGVPVDPDAAPAYTVFGQSGPIAATTGVALGVQSGTVTGASNATPIVVTSVAHGLATGSVVTITGAVGNTAANGTFTVTALTADTFSLNGSTGNGVWSAGGSWRLISLWRVLLAGAAVAALGAGQLYTLVVTWAVGGFARVRTYTFAVQ